MLRKTVRLYGNKTFLLCLESDNTKGSFYHRKKKISSLSLLLWLKLVNSNPYIYNITDTYLSGNIETTNTFTMSHPTSCNDVISNRTTGWHHLYSDSRIYPGTQELYRHRIMLLRDTSVIILILNYTGK